MVDEEFRARIINRAKVKIDKVKELSVLEAVTLLEYIEELESRPTQHALDDDGFCAHGYKPPVVHLCPECHAAQQMRESDSPYLWADCSTRKETMEELLKACHKFIAQMSPSGDERYYDIDPQDLKEFCEAVEAAKQKREPDSPYVCLHCGAHISSEHLPWCKSLTQNGGG